MEMYLLLEGIRDRKRRFALDAIGSEWNVL